MKGEHSKSWFARLVSGKIVKKYKLVKTNSVLTSLYLQWKHLNSSNSISSRAKMKLPMRMNEVSKQVREFLERDDNRQDAPAVWAHIQPVFSLIMKTVPQINALHFQSDGPSTQYKNRTNFGLFQQHCIKLGLESASWNFTTPGHGKSKADGAGGTVKTLCDRAVHAGRDIVSINDIIQVVGKSSKMHVFHVTEADIKQINKLVEPHI